MQPTQCLGITHKHAGWTDSRRYPTTWEVLLRPDSVYLSHARHGQHFTRTVSNCEASAARASMCNVETRESATAMSGQRGFATRGIDEPHLES